MSVEISPWKRQFIMDAHTPPGESCSFHVFADVKDFDNDNGMAFCFSCNTEHNIHMSLDMLWTGPSCKSLSKENTDRSSYAACSFNLHYVYIYIYIDLCVFLSTYTHTYIHI